ncbi:MAG: hypothetical protein IJX19_07310, partial [Clostridia bacterium]|nr:hypothetical protein [Clostridia bacterium]
SFPSPPRPLSLSRTCMKRLFWGRRNFFQKVPPPPSPLLFQNFQKVFWMAKWGCFVFLSVGSDGDNLSPPTGYVFSRMADRETLKQRVILSEANRKAVCEVELCVGEKSCMATF